MSVTRYISPQTFVLFKVAGVVPTVPDPATKRRYEAGFLDTDLELGEWARNIADGKLWFRGSSGIQEFSDDMFGPTAGDYHNHDSRYFTETESDARFIPVSQKAAINGVASLDGSGKVPAGQLPSYVDDVVEVANYAALPGTGTTGIIYVTIDTNLQYRWTGSVYVEISQSLALGETSGSAYRGDRGKTAYDHSQANGNPHSTTYGQVGALGASQTAVASAKLITASFTIEEVGGKLVAKKNSDGTVLGELTIAGKISAKDEIEPFAAI